MKARQLTQQRCTRPFYNADVVDAFSYFTQVCFTCRTVTRARRHAAGYACGPLCRQICFENFRSPHTNNFHWMIHVTSTPDLRFSVGITDFVHSRMSLSMLLYAYNLSVTLSGGPLCVHFHPHNLLHSVSTCFMLLHVSLLLLYLFYNILNGTVYFLIVVMSLRNYSLTQCPHNRHMSPLMVSLQSYWCCNAMFTLLFKWHISRFQWYAII